MPLAALAALAPVAPAVASGRPVFSAASPLTGRLLVTLRAPAAGARASGVSALLARTGALLGGPQVPEINMLTLRPPGAVAAAALAAVLRRDPAVAAVALERRAQYRYVPGDPALTQTEPAPGTPPGTPLEWWAYRQGFPAAWDVSRGDGVRVALIDSGVDASHPEFAGRIDQANAFDANPGDGPATTDEVGHGTHVAGLACAGGDNGAGISGAGLHCHLIVEKSDLTEASVIAAIADATNRGAQAINMSFGTDGSTPPPPQLASAVDYAYQHNVVLVSAAADTAVQEQGDPSNVLQPPGTGPDITQGRGLSVTSADFTDHRSSFAGLGSEISMAAYGSFADSAGPPGILSTFPGNTTTIERGSLIPLQPGCSTCRTSFNGDSRYAYLMGTSMAAPMVTATAGMMRQLNPDLNAADVIGLLKQTATRPAGAGWTPDLGWGILNAGAALAAARAVDRRAPVSRVSAPRTTRHTKITLTWTGSDAAPPGLLPSGVDHYELYRTIGRGAAQRIATLAGTSLRVSVKGGRLYGWYTLAVDRAGNRESRPSVIAHTRTAKARRRKR